MWTRRSWADMKLIVWVVSMYIGQGAKQIFKIIRPASPPAICLEDNPSLETEYGFPSAHATVATAITFLLWKICGHCWLFVSPLHISHLHVPSDCDREVVLHLQPPSHRSCPHSNGLVIFLLYIYPVSNKQWTRDRGDTAAILCASLGLYSASVLWDTFQTIWTLNHLFQW